MFKRKSVVYGRVGGVEVREVLVAREERGEGREGRERGFWDDGKSAVSGKER